MCFIVPSSFANFLKCPKVIQEFEELACGELYGERSINHWEESIISRTLTGPSRSQSIKPWYRTYRQRSVLQRSSFAPNVVSDYTFSLYYGIPLRAARSFNHSSALYRVSIRQIFSQGSIESATFTCFRVNINRLPVNGRSFERNFYIRTVSKARAPFRQFRICMCAAFTIWKALQIIINFSDCSRESLLFSEESSFCGDSRLIINYYQNAMETCFDVDKSFYDIDSADDLKQFWESELDPVRKSIRPLAHLSKYKQCDPPLRLSERKTT